MSVTYGTNPKFSDSFYYLDSTKWTTFGTSFGTITAANNSLTISNTTGTSTDYIGVYSTMSFGVGSSISVLSKSVSGRHHSLIGFGAAPYSPFPHGSTNIGCTWYSSADIFTSNISYRDETNTSYYDTPITNNLTNTQLLKIVRVSSSIIDFYRNGILEVRRTGLVFANSYPVFFCCDGYIKPNNVQITYVSVA